MSPGLGERLLCLFFPARCLLCGKLIPPGESLCPMCRKEMPETPICREFPLETGGRLLTFAPFLYEGGCRQSLHRLKFRGERGLSRPFGRVMAQALPEGESFDEVAWVPMTKRGKRKRGYDQSFLLARSVGRELGLPCLPLLEKTRETQIQHELSREDRAENVKGVYRADSLAAGKRLLLIDDIVTTGATLQGCAQALYQAGAQKVVALCAASTPISQLPEMG